MVSNIDPIDKMLQGDGAPQASQAGTSQQNDSIQPIEQQTEEEIEFNKLSGPAQDRFREAIVRARQAEERLSQLESQRQQFIPPAPNTLAPDQKQAIDTLSGFGISTDEKVKKEVNTARDEILKTLRMQSLEQKYSGDDGIPKFDRLLVDDYVEKHPQYKTYDLEDVFKFKMHPDEFLAASSKQQTVKKSTSLRPTKSYTQGSAITPDNVEEMVKSHDQSWYDEHLEEINSAVKAHTDQFRGQNFGGQ